MKKIIIILVLALIFGLLLFISLQPKQTETIPEQTTLISTSTEYLAAVVTELSSSTPATKVIKSAQQEKIDKIKNSTWYLPEIHKSAEFKFTDGIAYKPRDTQESETFSWKITLSIQDIVFGDYNEDGTENFIMIVTSHEEYTTGVFYHAFAFTALPHNRYWLEASYLLGDRIRFRSVEIIENTIHLKYLTHGPDEGLCCASKPVHEMFYIEDGKFITTLQPYNPITGRACGGGAMGNAGTCPTGYACNITKYGPPNEGSCVKK